MSLPIPVQAGLSAVRDKATTVGDSAAGVDAIYQALDAAGSDHRQLDRLIDRAFALHATAPCDASVVTLLERMAGTLGERIAQRGDQLSLTQRRMLACSAVALVDLIPRNDARQPLYHALAESCITVMRAPGTDALNSSAFLDQAYAIATKRLDAGSRAAVLGSLGDFVSSRMAAMSASPDGFDALDRSTTIEQVLTRTRLPLDRPKALEQAAELCFGTRCAPENPLHKLADRVAREAMQIGGPTQDKVAGDIAAGFLALYAQTKELLDTYIERGADLRPSDYATQLDAGLKLLQHAGHAAQCIGEELHPELATRISPEFCVLADLDCPPGFAIACFDEAFQLDTAAGPDILARMLARFDGYAEGDFSSDERELLANLTVRIECDAQGLGGMPDKLAYPDWLTAPRVVFHTGAAEAAAGRRATLAAVVPPPIVNLIENMAGAAVFHVRPAGGR